MSLQIDWYISLLFQNDKIEPKKTKRDSDEEIELVNILLDQPETQDKPKICDEEKMPQLK